MVEDITQTLESMLERTISKLSFVLPHVALVKNVFGLCSPETKASIVDLLCRRMTTAALKDADLARAFTTALCIFNDRGSYNNFIGLHAVDDLDLVKHTQRSVLLGHLEVILKMTSNEPSVVAIAGVTQQVEAKMGS